MIGSFTINRRRLLTADRRRRFGRRLRRSRRRRPRLRRRHDPLGVAARHDRGARRLSLLGRQEVRLFRRHRDDARARPVGRHRHRQARRPEPGRYRLSVARRLLAGLAQGIPLVSVFEMGGADVFDFAFRKGEAPADIKGLEGKTIVLGSAGWQSIADPMLKAAGVDITKVKYVDARLADLGHRAACRARATRRCPGKACAPSGRARASTSTTSSAAISRSCRRTASSSARPISTTRRSRKVYARYLQGWAAGLEFGQQNPRAATQIVMEQFPGLSSQMSPTVATESMMQLANVYPRPLGRAQEVGLPHHRRAGSSSSTPAARSARSPATSRSRTWSRTTLSTRRTPSTPPRSRRMPTASRSRTTTRASTSTRSRKAL